MEKRFIQAQGAARTKGRDVNGYLCSPVIDRNGLVVHGPHEAGFFLWPVGVPNLTLTHLIHDREKALPFLGDGMQ
jgi:hypothetical protein